MIAGNTTSRAWTSVGRTALVLTLISAGVLVPGVASSHFKLLIPPSAIIGENGGLGAPPCGEGEPSDVVTKVRGGHPYEVRILETAIHPGHYRIALSVRSRSELPKDPAVVAGADGRSISAAIDPSPRIPVLGDGLFPHRTAPRHTEWQVEVMLPNLDCERCTLQVIQFMANHPLNEGGGYFYHHCGDLKITADPNLPPADKAWFAPK